MKKSEDLVATLLAIYAIILTLCIAIYAIFKLLEVDITLATNLLIWSATIFAPIAVLMTYTSWNEQKNKEQMSELAKQTLQESKKLTCFINRNFYKMHAMIGGGSILNEVELSEIRFEVRNIVTTVCNNLSILEDEFATILDSRVLGAFAGRLISIEGLWSSSFSWDKINSNDLEKIHNLLELFDLEENCEVILKKIIYYKY